MPDDVAQHFSAPSIDANLSSNTFIVGFPYLEYIYLFFLSLNAYSASLAVSYTKPDVIKIGSLVSENKDLLIPS